MKINKVDWDNYYGYLKIVIDDNKFLLIQFKRDFFQRSWNKYLIVRNIDNIRGTIIGGVIWEGRLPPVRNLHQFIEKVALYYKGNIDSLAKGWLKEEKG